MRSLSLTGILLLFFHFTFAQSDFRPGYILQNEGDTLKGWISYREGGAQYAECIFKSGTEASPARFSPSQLIAYGLAQDRHYVSAEITKDSATYQSFALVLVRGKLSLLRVQQILYLQDSVGKTFEVSSRESSIKYYNDVKYEKTDQNLKKGIFIWKTSDYPPLQKKIERMNFDTRQFVKLVEEYNAHFRTSPTITKEKRPWTIIQLGPSLNFTHIKITDASKLNFDYYHYTNYEQLSTNQRFSPGISLFFSWPKISEKIWMHLDFLYEQHSYESLLERNGNSVYFLEINYTTITTPVVLSYHFTRPQSKTIPFIEGGVIASTIVKERVNSWREFTVDDNVTRYPGIIPVQLTPVTLSPVLGVGVSQRISQKLSVVLRARISTVRTAFNVDPFPSAREYSYSLGTSLLYSIKQ